MSTSRLWQLAARRLTQEATMEELRELEYLLKDHPELAFQLDMHGRFFSLKVAENEAEVKDRWTRQLALMRDAFPEAFDGTGAGQQPVQNRKRKVYTVAVILGLVVILCLAIAQLIGPPGKADEKMAAMITAANSKSEFTLPDGSKIILNKNSQVYLEEGFGKKNRSITLEGEAYFDVTHNAALPFVIQAANVQVKVLGTAFNVRAYKDEKEVETSLFRGSVEITDKLSKQVKLLMKPNEKVTIAMPETPTISGTHNTGIADAFVYKTETLHKEELSGLVPEVAWTEDKLVFAGETFENVARRLEKWYNVDITIEDVDLKDEKFTGVFTRESVTEALTALQITYPFQFHITKDGRIYISK